MAGAIFVLLCAVFLGTFLGLVEPPPPPPCAECERLRRRREQRNQPPPWVTHALALVRRAAAANTVHDLVSVQPMTFRLGQPMDLSWQGCRGEWMFEQQNKLIREYLSDEQQTIEQMTEELLLKMNARAFMAAAAKRD